MLDFMRRNANSWVMILLFAIIIFVFAINFGPWAGSQLSEGTHYAAIVNNRTISMAEFRTAYMSQINRIRQFRPDYDETQAEKDGLKQMVLEQLIARELLTQMGQHHKFKIGAVTLAQAIKERVFGPEAEFNKEEYKLRVNGYFHTTVSQFEEQIEKELIAQNMANLISTGVYISDSEAKKSFIDKNSKISVEYVKIDPKFFEVKEPSLQQTTDFIEKNQDKIASYFSENASKFNREKEIKASHILIKVPHEASNEEKAKLKERAQALLDRIKKGEDFAKVARNESEDLGSKSGGGSLGFFTFGKMVPEFSKAAFSMKVGEVSDLVQTPFGFHIIKVEDIVPEQKMTLAQASNKIAETLIKEEAQKKEAKALAEQALAQLQKNIPLEKISIPGLVNKKASPKASGKPHAPLADESTNFTRSTPYISGIGPSSGFSEQAFKLSASNKTSEVFEANNNFYALRLKSREDADMAKFEAEKQSIKDGLLYPRKRAFIQQYITYLKNNAQIKYNKDLTSSEEIKV